MNTDKKVLYTLSSVTLAVLLTALFIPSDSGRVTAAILLLPLAVLTFLLLKKRSILSVNKNTVILIMAIMGMLYVMLYYLSGLRFGFYKTGYGAVFEKLFKFALPIAAIIILSEVIRTVVRAQNSRVADMLVYLSCVIAEVLTYSNIPGINSFGKFMDVVGLTFFPAIISNLLYHYLSKRYGFFPNTVYRLLTSLYLYVIPVKPAMPDSLFSFVNLFIPILIYIFIDSLFEKKKKYALAKKHRLSKVFTVFTVIIMVSLAMLISNQFKFGTLVIATDSMTGELNRGDAAIYERYEEQDITVGQVIAFEKNGSVYVHRVVDIKHVDGVTQYYTQGDANDDPDTGFITAAQIVGTVDLKIPYVGFPTIWLRSLFNAV